MKRVYAPLQTDAAKRVTRYYCCACRHHGRRSDTCANCGSEDVFDKKESSWPCRVCKQPVAKFNGTCEDCLADLEENPREDYGSPLHRAFLGQFPPGIRRFGDPP